MAVPFPGAEFEILVYMLMGALIALVFAAGFYIRKLHDLIEDKDEQEDLRIDNIGLSHRAEQALETVMKDSMLQSEMPDRMDVSKATVSNAISELFERDLVIKKKKANTYLIEANREEIRKEQR